MNKKFTINSFQKYKSAGKKISVLTAYDYSMAKLLDNAGVDVLLVGDSLGMVVQGNETTLPVTVEEMIYHAKAVRRGAGSRFVVVDMPFLSYHVSVEEAVRNAGRIIKETGADAVKMEGGHDVVDAIKAIIRAQIPVVGHLGLKPQSVNILGAFKVQGKDAGQAQQIIDEAWLLQDAGVCAIVLECVPGEVARIVSEKLVIPTIGIGAGKHCDGQVLVVNDMLGLFTDFTPRFVKQYADVGQKIHEAVTAYINEINDGSFPGDSHTFAADEDIAGKLYN